MGLLSGGGAKHQSKRRSLYISSKQRHGFKYGGPAVHGECCPISDDVRCYRVEVNERKWFLYNDTLDKEAVVTLTLKKETGVHKVKYSRAEMVNLRDGERQFSIVVYPLETLPFVQFPNKTPVVYRATVLLRDVDANHVEEVNRKAKDKCSSETRAVAGVAAVSHSDDEVLYRCCRGKIPYVDVNFPPSEASLEGLRQQKTTVANIKNVSAIVWMRPQGYIPEIAHREINLFRHAASPEKIEQGRLGDCWLMCSIAVVAESKTMIHDIFRHSVSKSTHRKEEGVGGYRVCISKGGWFHNLIVDSYLPTYNGVVCFARSSGDPYELWVSLLEKAYAKVHGSYASIVGGSPLHALQDLTGFPVYSLKNIWKTAAHEEMTASQLFKDLRRYRQKGYLLCISTPGRDTSACSPDSGATGDAWLEARYRAAGLCTGHSYSVLKVRRFLIPSVKLLKIRNPWGSGDEWTGAWGKNSSQWRKHLFVRRSCRPSKLSDGTFWMEWRDVVQYFDGGGVCMVKKAWYQYRFPGKFIGIHPSLALKIELKAKQRIFFTLSQQDRRVRSPTDPERLYKGLLISVSGKRVEDDMQRIVALSTDNPEVHPPGKHEYVVARDVGLELELDPAQGPFYVIPRIMADNRPAPAPLDFTLGMLTPKKSTAKGLRASFLYLPDTCPVFRNAVSFAIDQEAAAFIHFQYKKRGGTPCVRQGTTAFDATHVRESYPY